MGTQLEIPSVFLDEANIYLLENYLYDSHRSANCALLFNRLGMHGTLQAAELVKDIDAAWNFGWNTDGFSLASLCYGYKLDRKFGWVPNKAKISRAILLYASDASLSVLWVPVLRDAELVACIPNDIIRQLLFEAREYLRNANLEMRTVTQVWISTALCKTITGKALYVSRLKSAYEKIDPAILLNELGPEVLLRYQDLGAMRGAKPRFVPSFFEKFLAENGAYASRPGGGTADVFATWTVLRILKESRYSCQKHRGGVSLVFLNFLQRLMAPACIKQYKRKCRRKSAGFFTRRLVQGSGLSCNVKIKTRLTANMRYGLVLCLHL
mgnify:CR=1 FL=1